MARKYKLLFSLLFLAALYAFLIRAALNPDLPSPQNPICFYSNQQRDDFRLVLQKLFSKARQAIGITMYAVTDDELLNKLSLQSQKGISVKIWHDRSNPIATSLTTIPVKAKGLMHRKMVVVDDAYIILGSANMTTSSLVLHDNLSVGLYHPALASFINSPTSTYFDFLLPSQEGRLWLLPDPAALDYLLHQLSAARSSIFVAMFTLTHPRLLEALIEAQQRGVAVTVALDRYAARGASRKAVEFLQQHNIPVVFSQGLQLLHHKWAYIDRQQIILGSTNWTKAAFTKNQDCLFFLNSLTPAQQKLFDSLSRTIFLESNETL